MVFKSKVDKADHNLKEASFNYFILITNNQ